MRITVRLPDDLGEAVKQRTDNVSAYVSEAIAEKLRREKRRAARHRILEMTGGTSPDTDLHALNQRERREEDRTASASGASKRPQR
jgi:Arc/MetJ-type ribon-helix-helix transcriptional regulator